MSEKWERAKARYAANPAAKARRYAQIRAWHKANREKKNIYQKMFYATHPGYYADYCKKYRERNKEAIKVARVLGVSLPEARKVIENAERRIASQSGKPTVHGA